MCIAARAWPRTNATAPSAPTRGVSPGEASRQRQVLVPCRSSTVKNCSVFRGVTTIVSRPKFVSTGGAVGEPCPVGATGFEAAERDEGLRAGHVQSAAVDPHATPFAGRLVNGASGFGEPRAPRRSGWPTSAFVAVFVLDGDHRDRRQNDREQTEDSRLPHGRLPSVLRERCSSRRPQMLVEARHFQTRSRPYA